MPLPFIIAGAALSALYVHDKEKDHLKSQDQTRHQPQSEPMGREPSEILPSTKSAVMVPGAIVCCEVFQAFIHTGIVVDDNTIVELHGNGLIRAISPQRFLENRSGKHLFIACDKASNPILIDEVQDNAARDVFNFYQYDVFDSNCYRHTWRWLSGEDTAIKSFEDFNRLLSQLTKQPIYWDCVSQ